MEQLRKRHISLITETSLDFTRYIYYQLPWNERLIGVKGSRGIGKTTLLLQYIKQNYGFSDKALYVSLDNLYFTENKLIDFVDDFVSKGGEHLFVDEVHKYKNWSIELKNIYDSHPKLKLVFTGSSLLEILNSRADLSRRALVYNMQGLSYREFLQFRHGKVFPKVRCIFMAKLLLYITEIIYPGIPPNILFVQIASSPVLSLKSANSFDIPLK